ncbi:MAG: lytic transglycosylase domain-containing protein [Microbacteriaceae bacterium]|nr:lytic transglycosylase domain-containing protein [Microbacteriaceae bacterium]
MVNSNAGVWCAAVLVLGIGGWLAGTAAASQSDENASQLRAQQVELPETALAQALSGAPSSVAADAAPTQNAQNAPTQNAQNSPAQPGPAQPAPAPAASSAATLAAASAPALLPTATGGYAAHISASWLQMVANQTGIPPRALRGYAGAALALSVEQPNCRLGWSTLAALGNIESGHGTHAGSALGADGVAQPSIYGPQLSGGAFGAIRDTDGGVLDGDPVWDRAVGPLQFIPSTWKRWGADGNGDGIADPQQIDDAALAAAHYLCHYGHLDTVEGWRAAIFGYNHSTVYVDDVANVANDYAGRVKQG